MAYLRMLVARTRHKFLNTSEEEEVVRGVLFSSSLLRSDSTYSSIYYILVTRSDASLILDRTAIMHRRG